MAINTGDRETGFDTQLARDANGLPYIPGTAVAGVWRHICEAVLGEQEARSWFGFTGKVQSQRSTLDISNGYVHNQHNQPVKGLQASTDIDNDALLSILKRERPLHREHVKINDRGVAAHEAKYDQVLLPTGVRFTIEIRVETASFTSAMETRLQQLMSLWTDRRFAFGAKTRNGLGRIKLIDAQQTVLDLISGPQIATAIKDWRDGAGGTTLALSDALQTTQLIAELDIKAIDTWRSGSGSQALDEKTASTVSMVSYSEQVIAWQKNRGSLSNAPRAILAGSTIKGILAHRLAFHYHRHTEQWAEQLLTEKSARWSQRPEGLAALLGDANDSAETQSIAGRLFVEDAVVHFKDTIVRTHNSIDRFTGGVRKGALYSEELLYQPTFTVKLWLQNNTKLDAPLQAALSDTLKDIEHGLLPIGAGAGRGTSLCERDPDGVWHIDLNKIQANIQSESEVTS